MIVLDTHVLLWVVSDPERLGTQARRAIAEAAAIGSVQVSAISLWEIGMLLDRRRIALDRPLQAWNAAVFECTGPRLVPVDGAIAMDAAGLQALHGDPADRMIVATARDRRCRLVTADDTILAYGAAGHVQVLDAAR